MSTVLRSPKQCPHCGHNDCFRIFQTNEHCFSCKHHKSYLPRNFSFSTNEKVSGSFLENMEQDFISNFPAHTKQWLLNYMDDPAIVRYQIQYSPQLNRIIFPLSGDSYAARSILDQPKWLISKGTFKWATRPFARYQGDYTLPTVIVEDIISAINIHRAGYTAVALLGTHMSKEILQYILKMASFGTNSSHLLWLDGDEAGQKATGKILSNFQLVVPFIPIKTEYDPKCYSTNKVREIITNATSKST